MSLQNSDLLIEFTKIQTRPFFSFFTSERLQQHGCFRKSLLWDFLLFFHPQSLQFWPRKFLMMEEQLQLTVHVGYWFLAQFITLKALQWYYSIDKKFLFSIINRWYDHQLILIIFLWIFSFWFVFIKFLTDYPIGITFNWTNKTFLLLNKKFRV